jgi:hypothetical protein
MQNYHLKINYRRLQIIILIIGVLAFISFFVTFAYQESGEGNEIIYYISKWYFIIIAFPDILASRITFLQNPLALCLGVLLGCLFHGLLIEFAIIKIHNLKNKKSIQIRN